MTLARKLLRADTRATDPYFANVALLLLCDGADASTSFIDSSANGYSVSTAGNAQIDTAQSKFGGASYLGDGNGDSLDLPSSAGLVAAGDFTLEMWVRPVSWGSSTHLVYGGGGAFTFQANGSVLTFYNGSLQDFSGLPATGAWSHLAIVRSGMGSNNVKGYINGVQDVQFTDTSTTRYSLSGAKLFGRPGTASFSLNGHADAFRFTVGVARWTSDFTPPTVQPPTE